MMRLALRFLIILFLTTVAMNAQQLVIGVGTTANDGSGDPVRTAFQKVNTNFTSVYLNVTTVSNLVGTVAGNLTTVSNSVGTVAGNLTTVSNSVGVVAANLTTVSNSLTGKINAQTGTTYAFLAADAGKLTTFTNAAAVAVTLAVFADGTVFHAKNLGAGLVTITPTGATIDFAATLILTKGQSASIFSDGANYKTTLRLANMSDELANVLSVVNSGSLSTVQRIDLYSSVDSVQSPTNFARMQISPSQIDFDEVGTGSLGAQFRVTHNGTARQVFDLLNATVLLGNGGMLGWTASTVPALYSQDLILRRKSAGVVSVGTVVTSDTGQFSSINGLSIGSIFSQTSDAAVGNTVTETSILGTGSGTKTVAANALNTIGRTLRVRIKGVISHAATPPTLTIRFKVASQTVLTGVFTVANASNDSFDFNVEMTTRTTGTSGTFASNGRFNHNMTTGSVGGVSLAFVGTQTNNFTSSNLIDVTAQWGTANALNSLASQIATIEILN